MGGTRTAPRRDRATAIGHVVGYALVSIGGGAIVAIVLMCGWIIVTFAGFWLVGALAACAAVALFVMLIAVR